MLKMIQLPKFSIVSYLFVDLIGAVTYMYSIIFEQDLLQGQDSLSDSALPIT